MVNYLNNYLTSKLIELSIRHKKYTNFGTLSKSSTNVWKIIISIFYNNDLKWQKNIFFHQTGINTQENPDRFKGPQKISYVHGWSLYCFLFQRTSMVPLHLPKVTRGVVVFITILLNTMLFYRNDYKYIFWKFSTSLLV